MGFPVWPNRSQVDKLRECDRLFLADWPEPIVASAAGQARLEIDLPMPGVARLALSPAAAK